jgi:hypothetical protein
MQRTQKLPFHGIIVKWLVLIVKTSSTDAVVAAGILK